MESGYRYQYGTSFNEKQIASFHLAKKLSSLSFWDINGTGDNICQPLMETK